MVTPSLSKGITILEWTLLAHNSLWNKIRILNFNSFTPNNNKEEFSQILLEEHNIFNIKVRYALKVVLFHKITSDQQMEEKKMISETNRFFVLCCLKFYKIKNIFKGNCCEILDLNTHLLLSWYLFMQFNRF